MSDLNNYFETLERSLKRISIVLIDDFEEIKKGNPIPIIALMRKILFSTSTIVMKHMLLRGCPSHTPDRKFVISVFDLLRETIKHQPAITLDQFFALGFAQHKIIILSKIADYVLQTDRTLMKSSMNKSAFVVPSATNEIVNHYYLHSQSEDERDKEFLKSPISTPSKSPSHMTTQVWPLSDFIKLHMNSDDKKSFSKSSPLSKQSKTSCGSIKKTTSPSPKKPISPPKEKIAEEQPIELNPDLVLDTNFSETPEENINELPEPELSVSLPIDDSKVNINQDISLQSLLEKNETFRIDIQKFIDNKVEELIIERVEKAKEEIKEKYDFVINQVVTAVDAEFTLLNNRIKNLEAMIAHQTS